MYIAIKKLLERLDGNGLVITDEELLEEALKEVGLSLNSELWKEE